MSKARLNKELQNMTADQLRQIILDAYDARPETKEYFEFFLNPDVEKLMEKFVKAFSKELNRMGWSTSKARVSVLKRIIKDFESLDPGPDAVMDMLFRALQLMSMLEYNVNLTPVQEKFIGALAQKILTEAERLQIMSQTIERLQRELQQETVTRAFRSMVAAGSGFTCK